MIDPMPPLTATELLECFDITVPSEIVAQIRVEHADDHERQHAWYFAGLRARWLRWGVQPR